MSNGKAKAPRPGVGRRTEEANAASTVIELRIKDQTRLLCPGTVTMRTRAALDNGLGMTFEECVASLGQGVKVHTMFGLWFVAGHQADPTLSFADDEAWFEAVLPMLEEGDIDAKVIEPDGSPEA